MCEIGPGPGGISRAVLEQNVKQFDVIELDGRFLPGLEVDILLLSEHSFMNQQLEKSYLCSSN